MSTMRKVMIGATGFTLVATSVLFSSPTASAGPETIIIQNDNSGKCMAVPNSNVNGTTVIQSDCSSNYVFWDFQRVSGGNGDRVTLTNSNTGYCLAIGSSSKVVGAAAIQWTCTGKNDQIWIWDSINRLRNVNSDLCLAVPNSSTANGTKLVQWTCSLNYDQRWL